MILADKKDKIVSSLGWVDKNGLWVLETAGSATPFIINVSDAKYLSIYKGRNNYFSIVHHYDSDKSRVTLHSFDAIDTVCAEVRIENSEINILGDLSLFQHAKCCYVPYLSYRNKNDFHLVLINPAAKTVDVQELTWYSNDQYDKGYQGVIGVSALPNQSSLIFCVQRSSTLILYDPVSQRVTNKIPLGERHGNPQIVFRDNRLIAIDYDTLVEIDLESLKCTNSIRLQDSAAGTQQFVGDMFLQDDKFCCVARPFSGDAVMIDLDKFSISHRAKLEKQPLEIVSLGKRVFARDWKTGELITGEMKRNYLFSFWH